MTHSLASRFWWWHTPPGRIWVTWCGPAGHFCKVPAFQNLLPLVQTYWCRSLVQNVSLRAIGTIKKYPCEYPTESGNLITRPIVTRTISQRDFSDDNQLLLDTCSILFCGISHYSDLGLGNPLLPGTCTKPSSLSWDSHKTVIVPGVRPFIFNLFPPLPQRQGYHAHTLITFFTNPSSQLTKTWKATWSLYHRNDVLSQEHGKQS